MPTKHTHVRRIAVVLACAAATAFAADVPVFCTDLGVNFEFTTSGTVRPAAIASSPSESGLAMSCLRHAPMNAVGHYLATQMDAFAVSAVDCVQESVASPASPTAEFFAVFSICSRSNVELQVTDARAWDASVRAQIDKAFGAPSSRNGIRAEHDAMWTPRHVVLSPSYELPDGKGMPRFEFHGAKIQHDSASGVVSVDVAVRNAGKVPLHLFRVTLIEAPGGAAATASLSGDSVLFALLPSPAVVAPDATESIAFRSTSSSGVTIAASKSYIVYISHSGFRGHRFDGELRSDSTFVATSGVATSVESTHELFGGLSSPLDRMDPRLTAFPLGSWRVVSVAIVAIVGLAATLYTRRRWSSVSFRRVSECLRRSLKQSASSSTSASKQSAPRLNRLTEMTSSSGWKKSKVSDADALHDTISDRELDALESDGLITSSAAPRPNKPRQSVGHDKKMPAIQMQWTPPAPMSDKFRKPLDLDGTARLDPKRFENLWDEYLQRFQSSETQAGRIDADALVRSMQTLGITCMASGTVNGVEKFVFYAKPRASDWFFFLVLDCTLATQTLGVTLRTSTDASDAHVDAFVRAAKTAIAHASSAQQRS